MIDVLASEPQYGAHLAPVHAALPPALRGRWWGADDELTPGPGVAIVASWSDHRRARRAGRTRIIRLAHGAGQSYGGDPETARHPAYAGGDDQGDVGLALVPNEQAAARWRGRYPGIDVRIVGSPRLDSLPALEPGSEPIVALSFHPNAYIGVPEAQSAWRHYRDVLPSLRGFRLIGHAHPRSVGRLRGWFERAGITFVPDFAEVCRRASLYVCDNSSTLYEFASTGRPVIPLNAPWYRPEVNHGLRFWEAAHVGLNVWDPGDLAAGIRVALEDAPDLRADREEALAVAYAYRSGAAARAADAIVQWMAAQPPMPAMPAAAPRPHRPVAITTTLSRPVRHIRPVRPVPAMLGTITVGMPYRGVPDLVGRAVRSVLSQTYRDLRLLVIGDGEEPPLEGISDPRVTVHVLPESHGAYFAHAVALAASPDAWYAPHDADDWTDPDHLARLVELERANRTGAVISGVIWKHVDHHATERRTQCWMGLYARSRLLEVGGFDPAERVAQDSHVVQLLAMTGRVVTANRATYHHVRRPDSLTQDPGTAIRSPFREAAKERNRNQVLRCRRLAPADIRTLRRQAVPADIAAAVDREAARLRTRLEVVTHDARRARDPARDGQGQRLGARPEPQALHGDLRAAAAR